MKEREPHVNTLRIKRILAKLKDNKAFALAIVGTSVALAGCGNKTNSNEASTTSRESPVATETQQKTNPVVVKHQSNADLVAEFINRDGGVGGYPLKCVITKDGSEYTISASNSSNEDVGRFEIDITTVNNYDSTSDEPYEPYTPAAELDTGGLVARFDEEAGHTVVDVPGLGAGDTIIIRGSFPNAHDLSELVYPRFPGAENSTLAYTTYQSGYVYDEDTGGHPWKPEINR